MKILMTEPLQPIGQDVFAGQTPCPGTANHHPHTTPYTHDPTGLNSNEICSTRILSSLPQNTSNLSYPFKEINDIGVIGLAD